MGTRFGLKSGSGIAKLGFRALKFLDHFTKNSILCNFRVSDLVGHDRKMGPGFGLM